MPLSTPELPFHPNVARSHFEEPWFENLQRPDNHLHPYRDPKSLYCCGEADVVRTKFKVCATWCRGAHRDALSDLQLKGHGNRPWALRGHGVRLQVSWSLQSFRHCSSSEEGARTRRQWEHALMLAKARVSDGRPLISSELL